MITTERPVQTVRIVRAFAASPEAVYRAWTDLDLLRQWSAPEGCTPVSFEADVRVGGRWESSFLVPPDHIHTEGGEFLELVPYERVVQTLRNDSFVCPGQGVDTIVTAIFRPLEGGRTEMIFTQVGNLATEEVAAMEDGWGSCFDQIAQLLGER